MTEPKGHDLHLSQKTFLVFIRLAIGWHLLSEGLGKFFDHTWTSAWYLSNSAGPFDDLFRKISNSEALLQMTDNAVTFGLILAGASLLLGLFTRLGCIIGLVLLSLFYLSQPPWGWTPQPGTESNYLIVNKNLIEALGLAAVVAFPTGRFAGLDSLLHPLFEKYLPRWIIGHSPPQT